MNFNDLILNDLVAEHELLPKLKALYTGKTNEERASVQLSRILAVCDRLKNAEGLEAARLGYLGLLNEAGALQKALDPRVNAIATGLYRRLKAPPNVSSLDVLREGVREVLDTDPDLAAVPRWEESETWWRRIAQEEAMPESVAPAPKQVQPPVLPPAKPPATQPPQKTPAKPPQDSVGPSARTPAATTASKAPAAAATKPATVVAPKVKPAGGKAATRPTAPGSSTPAPPKKPAPAKTRPRKPAESSDEQETDAEANDDQLAGDADDDDDQKPAPKQSTKKPAPTKKEATTGVRKKKVISDPIVTASDEDEVPAPKTDKKKRGAQTAAVKDEDETQPRKARVKPRAAEGTSKATGTKTWSLRAIRVHWDRDVHQALEMEYEGEDEDGDEQRPVLFDIFTLWQFPEMHGMRREDLAEYEVPCQACHKHREICVYRPTPGGVRAGSCQGCFLRQGKCSASSGLAVEMGKEIRWVYEPMKGEPRPKLRVPDISIRVQFVKRMVKEGHLEEWPAFLDKDGSINTNFSKDSTYDISDKDAIFWDVEKWYPTDKKYLKQYPNFNRSRPEHVEAKGKGKAKLEPVEDDEMDVDPDVEDADTRVSSEEVKAVPDARKGKKAQKSKPPAPPPRDVVPRAGPEFASADIQLLLAGQEKLLTTLASLSSRMDRLEYGVAPEQALSDARSAASTSAKVLAGSGSSKGASGSGATKASVPKQSSSNVKDSAPAPATSAPATTPATPAPAPAKDAPVLAPAPAPPVPTQGPILPPTLLNAPMDRPIAQPVLAASTAGLSPAATGTTLTPTETATSRAALPTGGVEKPSSVKASDGVSADGPPAPANASSHPGVPQSSVAERPTVQVNSTPSQPIAVGGTHSQAAANAGPSTTTAAPSSSAALTQGLAGYGTPSPPPNSVDAAPISPLTPTPSPKVTPAPERAPAPDTARAPEASTAPEPARERTPAAAEDDAESRSSSIAPPSEDELAQVAKLSKKAQGKQKASSPGEGGAEAVKLAKPRHVQIQLPEDEAADEMDVEEDLETAQEDVEMKDGEVKDRDEEETEESGEKDEKEKDEEEEKAEDEVAAEDSGAEEPSTKQRRSLRKVEKEVREAEEDDEAGAGDADEVEEEEQEPVKPAPVKRQRKAPAHKKATAAPPARAPSTRTRAKKAQDDEDAGGKEEQPATTRKRKAPNAPPAVEDKRKKAKNADSKGKK